MGTKDSFESKGKGRAQVEATLEKIVSDATADNEFLLYKLVNYRRGGSIMEAYAAAGGSSGGSKEVDNICKDQLVYYMYNYGRGKVISASECLNWRHQMHQNEVAVSLTTSSCRKTLRKSQNQMTNSISDHEGSSSQSGSSSATTPYDMPEDHEACWMLEQRGALGENPLHVLVICDTPTHTRVAKLLLAHYPKLASDIMEGREYFGLSPLHLAVAYNNMELVQALVHSGANVSVRACGHFFMPTDQQTKPKKRTNYEGLSYLGEYPLSWAACCENEAMYNYLLDHGADPNLPDSFGNMILHMVVISDKLGMYGYALRHPKKPANNELLNKQGLTPLTLACVLGRNNIFREMLELSSVEFWRFSNITCSVYPLIALDSIRPDGGTNWKSALMIILDGETDEHLDMLEGGVVQRLLEDKWKTFARNHFLKRLAFLFLHLLVISIAVYLRPETDESLGWQLDATNIIRHCSEVGSLVGSAIFIFVQQGSEILSQGLIGFLTNLARSPAKFLFLISNICMMLCIPCRLLHLRIVEDFLLACALPGSWFFLMFFAGAIRLTGPFVTMIYSMIAGDMVTFGIIYGIMLFGFSQAFYFLFKSCHVGVREADDTNIDLYETYWGTWMALYHMTLGNYEYTDFSKPKYSGLSIGTFVIFMVLVPILLLNMLIAMMGNTYANVISKSEKEFVKQWAKIVLALERSINKEAAKMHLDTYGIKIASSPDWDPGYEMKGLMVIKSKSKTKAQQRKGALMNWRRMGKKIVNEMRKHGCKGDQLLVKFSHEGVKKLQRKASLTGLFDNTDEEGEAEAPPPKDGLGEALSQLAFTHNLDIAGITSHPNPMETSVSPDPTLAVSMPTGTKTSPDFLLSREPVIVNFSPEILQMSARQTDRAITIDQPPISKKTPEDTKNVKSVEDAPHSNSVIISRALQKNSGETANVDSNTPLHTQRTPCTDSWPERANSQIPRMCEKCSSPLRPIREPNGIPSIRTPSPRTLSPIASEPPFRTPPSPRADHASPVHGGPPASVLAADHLSKIITAEAVQRAQETEAAKTHVPSEPPQSCHVANVSAGEPSVKRPIPKPVPALDGSRRNPASPPEIPLAPARKVQSNEAPAASRGDTNHTTFAASSPPEVIMTPSNLNGLQAPSTNSTPSVGKRRMIKGRRRNKSVLPSKIRKLTNKVSAATELSKGKGVDRPAPTTQAPSWALTLQSATTGDSKSSLPGPSADGPSSTSTVQNSAPPPSLTSHQDRWSKPALTSISAMVSWDEGDDSSDQGS